MRTIVIGLGIQGKKRLAIAGSDAVTTVDPVNPAAEYRAVEDVPLAAYDAALVCTPDDAKLPLLTYLLSHGKHVLVEKPLVAADSEVLRRLQRLAEQHGVACYTAYNHRFEPNLVKLKEVLEGGELGHIYLMKLFYGNGTAADVRASPWRDRGLGVIPDLCSHMLDLVDFLIGRPREAFRIWSANCMENQACDHVMIGAQGRPVIEMEATLLSWRNTFQLDVIGERGSAHVHCLCKWGPSTLAVRKRIFPSGKPTERCWTFENPDPTWAAEYRHFTDLCRTSGTNIDTDVWINSVLQQFASGFETKGEETRWAA
jgi:scyllo-inositol 2-dehydrogenase (NADP+)